VRENTREEIWDEVRSLREENKALWGKLQEVTNTLEDIIQEAQMGMENIKIMTRDLGGSY